MKILIITGASRTVVWFRKELIAFLQNKGNDVFVVACDNAYKQAIESLGVKFYCSGGDNRGTSVLANIKYYSRIKKIVKEISPDKIMTFQAKANTFGIIAAKSLGYADNISAMVEGLGNVYSNSSFRMKIIRIISNILYKQAFRKIRTVIFLNSSDKQRFIDMNLVDELQCMLINGIGVDVKKFNQCKQPPIDEINFVMIARVEKSKGVIEYCEAAKKIIKSGVNGVKFNYFGVCDSANNPLDNYADYVNNFGYTDDIKSALMRNHIMVLPTYYNEGLPRSIIEAMSMGKPIITTNRPGCNETVVEGVNGFFVKEQSIDDLVSKMLIFINERDKIFSMGCASRELAMKKFNSDSINAQIWERI